MKIAALDDWQDIAETSADWSALRARADVKIFQKAFANEDEAAAALADFDVIMAIRERTAFPATLLDRLPKLKMFAMTGKRGSSLDLAGMLKRGITVSTTGGGDNGSGTAQLALALMLAAARGLAKGDAAIRAGRFQEGVPTGLDLTGATLGLIGFGRIGQLMGQYSSALGMKLLAWSPNLTEERAREGGATYATKEELLEKSDVVSLHIVLSDRTRGLIGAPDLARMKDSAILVNTSRGPLIDEAAFIAALKQGRLFAALDVFNREPLPIDHPFRSLPNTVLTPHLGYGTQETFDNFYKQSIENVLAYLDGKPIRQLEL